MKRYFLILSVLFSGFQTLAQENSGVEKFSQLREELPTPTSYRTASGAPGEAYWQQKADYTIDVTLDDEKQRIIGSEVITYHNNSPHTLTYLWLQLDQNIYNKDSDSKAISTGKLEERMSFGNLQYMLGREFDGGHRITAVRDANGKKLNYTINKTMMRVDLPQPLKSKGSFTFKVDWNYNINNMAKVGGRSGYEHFAEDGNNLYQIAQWFPRMAVYDDVNGWQHKQFLGRGEFALPFGDYKVSITAPADHVVAGTGELQNASQVLTGEQQRRLKEAASAKKPVLIVTQAEAEKAEKSKAKNTKTWVFVAKNVRDYAWASSRKFIWDAMQVNIDGQKVWAMSYYPKEGNPLWGQYSTEVVAHTLRVYSKHTIRYPYPVAISVHGAVGGMEYPMLSFNGGRPEADGTYSDRTKYGMISVIIHEVGHNFFPMIINSDERQWSWMDEGLNTFVQFLAEKEWDRDYPSRRGEPAAIVDYMRSDKSTQVPIMTNSESILQFGNNAYGKPATALNILRETVMGRELFDYAFKEYANRWAFKHPEPADFFRTMEDASGVDLDWFWRGWFYTTDHCDIALDDVKWYQIDTQNPDRENNITRNQRSKQRESITQQRNKEAIAKSLIEQKPELKDFYNNYDPLVATDRERSAYQNYVKSLKPEEQALLDTTMHLYELTFRNNGGLLMPVIVEFTFTDGSTELQRIPAEIWRTNGVEATKVFVLKKPVSSIMVDPFQETADIDLNNNSYPARMAPSRFQLFKEQQRSRTNPMREQSSQQKNNSGGSGSSE